MLDVVETDSRGRDTMTNRLPLNHNDFAGASANLANRNDNTLMPTAFHVSLPAIALRTMIFAASFVLPVISGNSPLAWGAEPFVDFDAYAADALKDWHTPAMAVSVVKDGRVVFARGYGVRKLGGKDPVDADTVFPIASITKSFNATAIAMLVEEGKLSWTDPVTKHLREFELRDPYLTREVCIADLLAHRTGLEDPDSLSCSGALNRNDLIRRARYLSQVAPFRTEYHYNNFGTIMAGEILERVSGRSWAEFVRERVIRPLEMNDTVPDVLELKDVKNVVTSYITVNRELREDKSWNLPLAEGWVRYRETIRPAGAICSTVNDLAKFAIFQLAQGEVRGRQLLKADTIREMQALHSTLPLKQSADANLPYAKIAYGAGFGWQIRDYRGRKLVMHDGSTGTVIGLMPEENIGVVVLTNLGCGIQFMVMHDVIDRLLGIPRAWHNQGFITAVIDEYQNATDAENARLDRERRQDIKPSLALTEYAGTYESEIYGRLVVQVVDGTISMHLGPNCRSELVHWSGDRFRATFVLRFAEDWFLSFVSQQGRIAKVTISQVFPNREMTTFTRIRD
jgi:CubicO group peptidase (beta-lactamase class C family)